MVQGSLYFLRSGFLELAGVRAVAGRAWGDGSTLVARSLFARARRAFRPCARLPASPPHQHRHEIAPPPIHPSDTRGPGFPTPRPRPAW